MNVLQRLLLGLILMIASFFVLWWGSPMRTGTVHPELVFGLAFNLVFALGFILASMALLGLKNDYPGFLSGVVFYFIIGALIAVALYATSTQVGRISLEDAAHSEFWVAQIRVASLWPLELVRQAGFLDYQLIPIGTR